MSANEMMPDNQALEDDGEAIQTTLQKWIRTPRGLAVIGIAVAVAGLAIGWNWLAAVGALPILLSVLPCAAMCALGLCMMNGRKSCASQPNPSLDAGVPIDRAPQERRLH